MFRNWTVVQLTVRLRCLKISHQNVGDVMCTELRNVYKVTLCVQSDAICELSVTCNEIRLS